MAAFVDFQAIKEHVSIAQVVQFLDLRMKGTDQLRSACPACRTGGDRALAVNVTKSSYYCFAEGRGGDLIGLCAHIKGIGQREAAQEIAEHFRIQQQTTPAPGTVKEPVGGMKPLDHLEFEHPALDAIGFDAETAEALGIGHAPKGLMKGYVAVPVRLPDGTLAGYIGIQDAKLPPKWQLPTSNVVPLKKTTA